MNKDGRSRSSQAGLGLAETIIAGAVASVILMGIAKFVSASFDASSKVNSSLDLSSLRIRIQEGADCSASFGTPAAAPCTPGQYVDILNSKGGDLVPRDGVQMGKWFVRARCDANGISLRAAQVRPGADALAKDWSKSNDLSDAQKAKLFVQDELRGVSKSSPSKRLFYDWSHPKGNLIPSGSGGLCAHLWGFAPDTKCAGPNQYIKSVNLYHRVVECGTVPTCGGTEVLHYDGKEFRCSDDVAIELQGLEKNIIKLDNSIENRIIKQIQEQFVADSFVTVSAFGGSGSKRATVQCPSGTTRVSCGGSRQPNLEDTCPEESCGFVGVMPEGKNGCSVGIDDHSGVTNPAVYAVCYKLPK